MPFYELAYTTLYRCYSLRDLGTITSFFVSEYRSSLNKLPIGEFSNFLHLSSLLRCMYQEIEGIWENGVGGKVEVDKVKEIFEILDEEMPEYDDGK